MAFAGLSTVLALGVAGCSTSVKMPSLGGPTPDQPQEMDFAALNAERTRLLAERDELNTPLPSSKTQAQREAELTLFTVAKVQFDKGCPAVANGPADSVVR